MPRLAGPQTIGHRSGAQIRGRKSRAARETGPCPSPGLIMPFGAKFAFIVDKIGPRGAGDAIVLDSHLSCGAPERVPKLKRGNVGAATGQNGPKIEAVVQQGILFHNRSNVWDLKWAKINKFLKIPSPSERLRPKNGRKLIKIVYFNSFSTYLSIIFMLHGVSRRREPNGDRVGIGLGSGSWVRSRNLSRWSSQSAIDLNLKSDAISSFGFAVQTNVPSVVQFVDPPGD